MNTSRATLLMTALVAVLIAVAVFVIARTWTAAAGDLTDAGHRPRTGYVCPRSTDPSPACVQVPLTGDRSPVYTVCPRQPVTTVRCTTVYPTRPA